MQRSKPETDPLLLPTPPASIASAETPPFLSLLPGSPHTGLPDFPFFQPILNPAENPVFSDHDTLPPEIYNDFTLLWPDSVFLTWPA